MQFDYKRLVKFEHNLGAKEKQIRLYAGIVLILVSLFTASVLLLLVGGVLVATSFFGWCPAYSGFCHSSVTAEETATVASAEPEQASESSSNDH